MNKSGKALILAGVVLALCPSATVLSSGQSKQTTVENRLRKLAGRGATDCGRVGPQNDPSASSECVLKSFANHQPFYVVYDTQEFRVDSYFIDALAGDNQAAYSTWNLIAEAGTRTDYPLGPNCLTEGISLSSLV